MVLKINDRIRNRKIDFFTNVRINLKYDCIASDFALEYFFDPDNPEHKEFSCVGHFHLATLEENNELLMSAFILSIQFTDEPKKKLTTISGYSLTGPLEDCQIPKSAYPLQSNGLSLRAIVDKFLKPFGIKYIVDASVSSDMDLVFVETEAGPTQSVKSYLTELATQRNIVISNDEKGRVVFTRPNDSKVAIFHFERNMPGVSMTLAFNGQALHSDYYVMMQSDPDDENATETEIENSYVPIVYRPFVGVVNSADGNTVQKAASNIRANELRNVTLVITIDRWILGNKIVKPGEFVTVTNPQVYLYKKSKWFIESVDLSADAEKKQAVLKCVRPEVYTGKNPEYLWKGINLH